MPDVCRFVLWGEEATMQTMKRRQEISMDFEETFEYVKEKFMNLGKIA